MCTASAELLLWVSTNILLVLTNFETKFLKRFGSRIVLTGLGNKCLFSVISRSFCKPATSSIIPQAQEVMTTSHLC